MADGTISLAEGLGIKALDSNELRRKQKNLVGSESPLHIPISQTDKPNNSTPFEFGTPQMSNSGDCKNGSTFQPTSPTKKPSPSRKLQQVHASHSVGVGVYSPKTTKHSSPSRKLQQVFEEALGREAEERAADLLAGNTKNGNNLDHSISQDVRVGAEVAVKGSVPSSSSVGPEAISPKSQNNPSSNADQKFQQQQVTHLHGNTYEFQRTPSEVRKPNPNSKILLNPRGNPYVEGDPNMGYSIEDTQPRYRQVHSYPALPSRQPHNPKPFTGQSRPKPKNWAALLQSQKPSLDMELDYFPDLQKGKEAVVEIDLELTEVGKWNRYLVGHFLDGKMPYALLFSTARNQWKELFVAVKPDVAGFYLFEFKDEQAKQQVLEGGPYFFSQKYLVLKDWHRMLKPAQEQPSKIPAWVKFHDLPFELWNKECLSRVASTIGKPLHVDQATARTAKQPGLIHTKSSKARICIEINAELELPEEVTVVVEGESVVISVEYQVLPPMCSVCHVFGHSDVKCPMSNVQCATKVSTSSSLPKVEGQIENVTHERNGCSSPPQQSNQQSDQQDWVQVKNGKHKIVQELSDKGETDLHVMSVPSVSGTQYCLADCTSVLVEQVQSDSDEELLGVLEKVVSSAKGEQIVQIATPLEGGQLPQSTSSDSVVNTVGEVASITSIVQAEQLNPKPPDLLSGKSKENVPSEKQPLTKSAQKKLRKQAREQALCSFSRREK